MKIYLKVVFTLLSFFLLHFNGNGQSEKKITGYILAQYSRTLYDYTKETNPWGLGLNLHSYLKTTAKFKPTFDLSADFYFVEDVVESLFPPIFLEGLPPDSTIDYAINALAGYSYQITERTFATFVVGPSLIDGKVRMTIKPSIQYYLSRNRNYVGRISFTNTFNRIKRNDFGSIVISFGRRIF